MRPTFGCQEGRTSGINNAQFGCGGICNTDLTPPNLFEGYLFPRYQVFSQMSIRRYILMLFQGIFPETRRSLLLFRARNSMSQPETRLLKLWLSELDKKMVKANQLRSIRRQALWRR